MFPGGMSLPLCVFDMFCLKLQLFRECLHQDQWPLKIYVYILFLSLKCGRADLISNSVKCWRCCVRFRTGHSSALPVKRLWQFLVKQEEVQETFIRYIFTKKRDPNEVRPLLSKRCSANPHPITRKPFCSNKIPQPG